MTVSINTRAFDQGLRDMKARIDKMRVAWGHRLCKRGDHDLRVIATVSVAPSLDSVGLEWSGLQCARCGITSDATTFSVNIN